MGPWEEAGLGHPLPQHEGLVSMACEWQPHRYIHPGSSGGSGDEVILDLRWGPNLIAACLIKERRGEQGTLTPRGGGRDGRMWPQAKGTWGLQS